MVNSPPENVKANKSVVPPCENGCFVYNGEEVFRRQKTILTESVMNMKLWGGRFGKATDGLVDDFHSSISFDQRLFEQDITGSIAHATMLGEQGIIPAEDADKIVAGLKGILEDAREGKITWRTDAEDIHMNVETLLTERIGEAGKRLHTGRSRNDQVALDSRMYAKAACLQYCSPQWNSSCPRLRRYGHRSSGRPRKHHSCRWN